MVSSIEKVVIDFLDAFSQHDINRSISFFSDDCVYTDMAFEKTYNGKKELADFFNQLSKEFPDHKWELVSIFSTTNKVAFESIWSGTHSYSSNPDIPATGNLVKLKASTIMEFRDDKICKVRDYYNLPVPKQG